MIIFDNRQEKEKYDEKIENLIKKVIEGALKHEEFSMLYEISVSLVDNKEIREINNEFREIDRATDVLSFPMIEYGEKYFTKDFQFEKYDITPDGEVPLGDIVLSLERAKEQSIEYNHSYEREVAFLICHSVLHLLGHDHEEEKERRIMREREENILKSLLYIR